MQGQEQQGKKNNAFRKKHIIVFAIVVTAIVIMIIMLFNLLYGRAKQNLIMMWKNNVIQQSRGLEFYLARTTDTVEFSSVEVESMLSQGKTNEEIEEFLIAEMESYVSLVDNNYTGIYGYVRGEYLDASSWVPGPGYDPKTRPWYRAAVEAGGGVACVTPYVNLQNQERMMSFSKLLQDGESVISMDIYLDTLQRMMEECLEDECVRAAFILDQDGCVVVHSNPEENGKNYRGKQGGSESQEIMQALLADGSYSLNGADGKETLFAETINNDWVMVLILDETELLKSIQYVIILLIVVLVLAVFGAGLVFFLINRKYREAEQLNREMSALADIYEAMTMIDLKTDRMSLLRTNDFHDQLLKNDLTNYSKRILLITKRIASDESMDLLLQFMNPETYEVRMKNIHSISHDFMDARGLWVRFQLIVVDRDSSGNLWHIIWAVESINEERQQKDYLRKLAETDALSQIRNRNSGESGVRTRIREGQKGVFILLDIDDFKLVNDNYGHDVGDHVIIAVADSLRETFRDTDIVFRLGGDEFAVFVSEIQTEEQEQRILSRLTDSIDRIAIPEMEGKKVSVSIGTSFYPLNEEDSFEALYQRADKEMYEKKRKKKQAR